MTDAFDAAANAFDTAMGNNPAPRKDDDAAPTEDIFSNSEQHEEDQAAGGDAEEDEQRSAETDPEADPDEDADPEADPDESDDEDEEEVSDDELDGQEFEVMVEGQPTKVKLREALDGYIRTQTFHQRLNKLNDFRKELTGAAEKLVADRQRTDEILGEAEATLQAILPPEPDWDKLYTEDPKSARELQKQYDGLKGKIAEVREKRQKAQKEAAEKALADQQEFARTEFPKFAAKAGWKDQKQAKRDIDSMRATALSLGFTEQEVSSVYDSRMLSVLLKAAKYDRLMAAKPKAVIRNGKPLKPGAGTASRTAQRGVSKAQKKLSRTGSVDDAAAVMSRILNT
jgi:hypothetical protein